MAFHYRYLDDNGSETVGPELEFNSKAQAQVWLTDQYTALAELGVAAVTLLDGNEEVAEPMSLRQG